MSENLNDIFADVTNTPANDSSDCGAGIKVDIYNSASRANGTYEIYPENTIEEVFNVCKNDLCPAANMQDVIFEYNGQSDSDLSKTVKQLGIVDGSKLLFNPNGRVA